MLTRGRGANHLYLQAVGDGGPHVLDPEDRSPAPPTTLQQYPRPRRRADLRHHSAA